MGLISRVSSRTYRKSNLKKVQKKMEFVFGIVGKDFTLLCSDGNAARSIICYQQNHDRIIELNKHNALAMSGDPGDVEQFSEFVKANCQLYSMRHNYENTPEEAACYTRRQLAVAIRKNPYIVRRNGRKMVICCNLQKKLFQKIIK